MTTAKPAYTLTYATALTAPIVDALATLGIEDPHNIAAVYQRITRTTTGRPRRILGSSHKVELSRTVNVLTVVAYLAPGDISGVESCAWRSRGCSVACLGITSGHLAGGRAAATVQRRAQVAKSLWRALFPADFRATVIGEISRLESKATRLGMVAAVRLDGTSDFGDCIEIAPLFPDVRFYDYTKNPNRALNAARGKYPSNVHITYSHSDNKGSRIHAERVVRAGGTSAVVFRNKAQAARVVADGWNGLPAVDGDRHDARFMDSGAYVALYNKAGDRVDPFGFIVDLDAE